jgi:hypothetical protein
MNTYREVEEQFQAVFTSALHRGESSALTHAPVGQVVQWVCALRTTGRVLNCAARSFSELHMQRTRLLGETDVDGSGI